MLNRKRLGVVLGGLALVIAVFAILAIIGGQVVSANKTNPPVVSEPNWDSPQTRELMQRACFDCHSNETVWPWYSAVPPMSQIMAHNVSEGRAKFNVSQWPSGEGREAAETVAEGEMPPADYLLLHPNARLSQAEKAALLKGMQATFGG